MKEEEQITTIARVAHEVNRAFCRAHGDNSQPPWGLIPRWQLDSLIQGIHYTLNNPSVTPSENHENWMSQKIADGWIYGPEKDPDAKTHPCLVPYEQLPQHQKVKDWLFRAVVLELGREV